ncbi:MAG: PHP domain-containing protein [Verrucomicrobiia bacterium]
MIKVDLHIHTSEDPEDGLRYPATSIIDKAVELGFGAIAITLHGRVLEDERVFAYAQRKGLLLIHGVEWRSDHGDVLLYNVTQRELERLRSLADLRAFRRDRGDDLLVIAAHPYFFRHSLNCHLIRNLDLFDAVEYCHLHFPWLNLNRRGVRIAEQHGKAVVATSDAHNLWMFGRHYTLVDAAPTQTSIFRAIRERRVQLHSPHVSIWDCLRMIVFDPILERSPGKTVESFANQPAK